MNKLFSLFHRFSSLFFFCFIFFLPSCVLYTPYKRSCLEIPDSWRTPGNETSTEVNIKWWEQLEDPVLDQLILEAIENNNDIQIAVARVAQFKARLGIVSSQLYPQITAQGTGSRQRMSQTLPGQLDFIGSQSSSASTPLPIPFLPANFGQTSAFLNNYQGVLNAAYELDLWGKIRSATDASYAELLAQVETRRTVILTIISSVANSYIILRQYDRQLQISLQTLKSRQESYELAFVRFVEGLTSELEVKQAASEVDEAQIQVIQLNELIPQQENLISILIGHPPASIIRGSTIEQWKLPPQIPQGLPSDLLEQRPDIRQAEDLLIAANARIGEARALFFPDLTFTGYYGTQSGQVHELFTNPSKIWLLSGNLLQPIFEGGRLISNLDLTNAVKREAYYNYRQTILTAFQEVDNALVAHEQSKKALIAEYQRVEDLRDYLKLATLQYENGLVDYLNVLDAERRLFSAQLDLAQSQAFVFTTLVNIYQSLGGGWVIDADNTVLQDLCISQCSS